MIKGKNINYSHKEFDILKDVNVEMLKGEFLAIVGPNGAGKSTLLSILANELSAKNKNKIWFKEKEFKHWNLKNLAKNKAKFSQHNPNDITLTVKDVVMMGRYPYFYTTPHHEDFQATEDAMKETDVFHLKEREYNHLSGGEKQRVHLARVLTQLKNEVAEKLLFLDEPLNNLDVKHQYKVLQTIKDFTLKSNSAIVVLHDLNLAAQFADKIILMKNGKITADGKPQDVFVKEIIQEAYNFPCVIFNNPVTQKPMIVFG